MDFKLVLLKRDGGKKEFPLAGDKTMLGRSRQCDMAIPVVSVSRKHCRLESDGKVVKLRDLNSRNGTFVNDKRVKETSLQPGDSIKIGPLKFLLQTEKNRNSPKRTKTALEKQKIPSASEEAQNSDIPPEDFDTEDLDAMLDEFFEDYNQ